MTTYVKSSIILFTTIILLGISVKRGIWEGKKKPGNGYYIQSEKKPPCVHFSSSALYFSFPFKTR